MTDRKQPGVAFWGSVVLVVILFGYPLSFGPACWAVDGGWIAARPVASVFRPILVIHLTCRGSTTGQPLKAVSKTIEWYAAAGAGVEPELIVRRLDDAAKLFQLKCGVWPPDASHDVAHRGFCRRF